MAKILQNTLYLLSPGISVHRDGLSLRIEKDRERKLSVPIHNLESIFVFGPELYISPATMQLCWQNGVSICFFTEWGRLEARVEGVPYGSVLLRRSQHRAESKAETCASLARSFVAGKIHNTRWLISRTTRDTSDDADRVVLSRILDELAFLLRELGKTSDELDSIRGIEGRAAFLHFDAFHLHLKPPARNSFPFDGRNRRPPRDAVNCLLSFLYALMRHDCVSALTAVGLDPFAGFLHADRAGRESLALDLMEEFRPWLDRLAITLINRGEVKHADFQFRDGGGVELSDTTRKTLVAAYQQRKIEEVKHPMFKEKVRHGQIPFIQARLLARSIREDMLYKPHLFS